MAVGCRKWRQVARGRPGAWRRVFPLASGSSSAKSTGSPGHEKLYGQGMPYEVQLGWFASIDEESDPRWPWQPCLQLPSSIGAMQIWFATEEECLDFIRTYILGKGIIE